MLLDLWGNPYHYREWASVATALKNDLLKGPPLRTGFVYPPGWNGPTIKQTQDRPHSVDGYDVWSNGPNGINEYGDPFSDDVVSWSD